MSASPSGTPFAVGDHPSDWMSCRYVEGLGLTPPKPSGTVCSSGPFVNPNNDSVHSSDEMAQDPFNIPAAATRLGSRSPMRHERLHRRYERLRKDQQSYFLIGLWLVLQGFFLLLSLNWILTALGLASLVTSIYCFFLVWDAGKRKRMILGGAEDKPSPRDHAEAPSLRARVEGNGIRFLILLGATTLVLLAVGLLRH